MKISRNINGKSEIIELTYEELQKAHQEFVTNFMQSEVMNSFGYSQDDARVIAMNAYDKYCTCDGLTEYECIEEAISDFEETRQEILE